MKIIHVCNRVFCFLYIPVNWILLIWANILNYISCKLDFLEGASVCHL
jgi:hypothetical protein